MRKPKLNILLLYSDREFTPWKENIDSKVIRLLVRAIEDHAHVTITHFSDMSHSNCEFMKAFDIVFNVCYGFNLLSQVDIARYLDDNGILHTASGATAQAHASDKQNYEHWAQRAGVKSPRIVLPRELSDLPPDAYLIIKDRYGSCHRNIQIASAKEFQINSSIRETDILQEYIFGREFTVGIIPSKSLRQLQVLQPMEIIPINNNKPFIAGTAFGKTFRVSNPSLTRNQRNMIKNAALNIHEMMGLKGYSRMDFRLDANNKLYVLDVNTMPNLHPRHSYLPYISRNCGIKYNELIRRILFWFILHHRI